MIDKLQRGWTWWIAAGFVGLIGLVLRLWELGDRTFSHPENYTAGLHMPAWMPFVTRRVDLGSLVHGTLGDGHPPLYYAFELYWTKLFGSELWALRLPSVLFGTATILVVYAIGARIASRRAGLIAAGLLALHGHHIFFSQLARLYVFAAFFAALSTLFLLRARRDNRVKDHLAYVLATACALWSFLYCWPFVFAQMVWSTLASASRGQRSNVLVSQAFAILLALPVVALTLYQNPSSRWAEDQIGYLGFGYAADSVTPFWSTAPSFTGDDLWIRIAFTIALVIVGVALAVPGHRDSASATPAALSSRVWRWMLLVAVVVAAEIAYFAAWARPKPTISEQGLLMIAALPLAIAAALPLVMKHSAPEFLRRGWIVRATQLDTLPVLLAILPYVCMLGVSMARASFTARGTIIFLPFLMLAVAQGIDALFRWRWVGRAALTAAALLVVFSARYYSQSQSSPRDYAGLATSLRAVLEPEDLILVRATHHHDQPLLYYFAPPFAQFVGKDHATTLGRHAQARVWVVQWEGKPIDESIQAAIAGYSRGVVVSAHEATATAFLPP